MNNVYNKRHTKHLPSFEEFEVLSTSFCILGSKGFITWTCTKTIYHELRDTKLKKSQQEINNAQNLLRKKREVTMSYELKSKC